MRLFCTLQMGYKLIAQLFVLSPENNLLYTKFVFSSSMTAFAHGNFLFLFNIRMCFPKVAKPSRVKVHFSQNACSIHCRLLEVCHGLIGVFQIDHGWDFMTVQLHG